MPSVLQVFTISAIKCFVILLIRAGGQDGSIGRGVRGGCVPTQSLGRYPRSAWVADRIFPSQTNRSLSAARRARRLSRFGCATPAMPAKGCKGGGREARDKIRSQDKVARGQVQSFRKLPNPVILRALIKSGAHKGGENSCMGGRDRAASAGFVTQNELSRDTADPKLGLVVNWP